MRFVAIFALATACASCTHEVCDCGYPTDSGADTRKLDVSRIPASSCVADGTKVIVTCGLGNTCRMQSGGLNAVCVPGFVAGAPGCGGIACEAPCACVAELSGICDCNAQTAAP